MAMKALLARKGDGLAPDLVQDASESKGRRCCADRGGAAAGVS